MAARHKAPRTQILRSFDSELGAGVRRPARRNDDWLFSVRDSSSLPSNVRDAIADARDRNEDHKEWRKPMSKFPPYIFVAIVAIGCHAATKVPVTPPKPEPTFAERIALAEAKCTTGDYLDPNSPARHSYRDARVMYQELLAENTTPEVARSIVRCKIHQNMLNSAKRSLKRSHKTWPEEV